MKTYKLVCETRDIKLKVNKIRANGFVPAVIFGRHIDSLSLQIKENLAIKFLQNYSVGSKVSLEIDGKDQLAIFKEVQSSTLSNKINHISFHALTSGEKIKVSIPVNYINKDSLDKDMIIQEQLNEVEISSLPEFLIDYVTVDISKYGLGDSVHVSDLDISKNENIEVISSQDSRICTIAQKALFVEEVPEEAAETDEAAPSTETTEE